MERMMNGMRSKSRMVFCGWVLFTAVFCLPGCQRHQLRVRERYRVKLGIVPEKETLEYRQCSADSDCVYVPNGCCDYGTSMVEISVNKTMKTSFKKRLEQGCSSPKVCPDIGRTPPEGTGGNICKQGMCTYIPSAMDRQRGQVYWEYPKGVRHYPEEERNAETKPADIGSETDLDSDTGTDSDRTSFPAP